MNKKTTEELNLAVKELYFSLPSNESSFSDFYEKLLSFNLKYPSYEIACNHNTESNSFKKIELQLLKILCDNASIDLNDCKSSDADRSPQANSLNETSDYSFSDGIK